MTNNIYNDRLAAVARRRRVRMANWRERGLTLAQIGAKFGITPQKVWAHLKKHDATVGKRDA